MWVQQGNSKKWSIYRDDNLYYSFSWRYVSYQRDHKYTIDYYITTEIMPAYTGEDIWTPSWMHRVTFGQYPDPPKYLTRGQKDKIWDHIHENPVSFITLRQL